MDAPHKIDVSEYYDGEIFCLTEFDEDMEEVTDMWFNRDCALGIYQLLKKFLGE